MCAPTVRQRTARPFPNWLKVISTLNGTSDRHARVWFSRMAAQSQAWPRRYDSSRRSTVSPDRHPRDRTHPPTTRWPGRMDFGVNQKMRSAVMGRSPDEETAIRRARHVLGAVQGYQRAEVSTLRGRGDSLAVALLVVGSEHTEAIQVAAVVMGMPTTQIWPEKSHAQRGQSPRITGAWLDRLGVSGWGEVVHLGCLLRQAVGEVAQCCGDVG